MTRIIAGDAGSLRLTAPAKVSRPTADRVREALFSRLDTLTDISGSAVLDLFAGTGALGLEAASRGAAAVWLVDNHQGAAKVLAENVDLVSRALRHSPTLRVVKSSVATFLAGPAPTQFSVVFLDPPYDYSSVAVDDHLRALTPWLASPALVIVERSAKGTAPQFPEGFMDLGPKTYGDTALYWARWVKGSQPPASESSS